MQGHGFTKSGFLSRHNIDGTRAFFTLADLELNRLSLVEGGKAAHLYLRVMDKQVFIAVVGLDKTITFVFVKPLYCTSTHNHTP